MGLITKILALFGDTGPEAVEPPAQSFKGNPVVINGHPDAIKQRLVSRLMNLYNVRNPSDEVINEIERYRAAVADAGLEIPNDADEAELLLAKVRV